jgi:hypothetical protein
MFRPRWILRTCLFILIGSFLYSAPSDAKNKEVINPPQNRFEISFGGGWGLYSMRDINKHYIDEFAKESGVFDDHIDNGPNLFGEVGYFVSPNVSANFGVTYLYGSISKKENVIITWYDYQGGIVDTFLEKGSLTTTLVAPELKVKYHFPFEKTDLFLSGGAAWCFGGSVLKAETNSPDGPIFEEYRFTAKGLGFAASTGAWYNLNKMISFGAEIGYRVFGTGDLKDKNGRVWVVGDLKDGNGKVGIEEWPKTSHKMNLDFSGPFILGGLRLKL